MSLDDPRAAFEDAFVRWRFGHPGAEVEAIAGARALLATAPSAAIHLKLGLLLRASDPVAAAVQIDRARALGADLPRSVSRADESGAPAASPGDPPAEVESRTIDAASRRRFAPPSGDGWHPGFDLAQTDLPALRLFVVDGGAISIDLTHGRPRVYVFDAQGRLAEDLSTGPEPFRDPPVSCAGPVVLLDDSFATFNVAHALFDKFPRLAAYEARFPGRRLSGLMFLDHPYYRQALDAFGHDLITVPPSGRVTVRCETLALMSNHRRGEVRHPAYRGTPAAVAFIRSRLQAPRPGSRPVYLSRRDAGVRRLVNEDQVEARFHAAGFAVETIGDRDFADQRALFAEASHIAGVHGAGLANLVFAHATTRVLEISPPLGGNAAFWVMARSLGQPYSLFLADDARYAVHPGATYDSALTNRPIRVDTERLDRAIAAFLA